MSTGTVHVVLVGAESVDPATGAATVSAGCREACDLAQASRTQAEAASGAKPKVKVVTVCASWGEASAGAVELPKDAQGMLHYVISLRNIIIRCLR